MESKFASKIMQKVHINVRVCCSVAASCHVMEVPVERDTPGVAYRISKLLTEIFNSHFPRFTQTQCISGEYQHHKQITNKNR